MDRLTRCTIRRTIKSWKCRWSENWWQHPYADHLDWHWRARQAHAPSGSSPAHWPTECTGVALHWESLWHWLSESTVWWRYFVWGLRHMADVEHVSPSRCDTTQPLPILKWVSAEVECWSLMLRTSVAILAQVIHHSVSIATCAVTKYIKSKIRN